MRMSLYAGLAFGGGLLIAASGLLWLRMGERIYFDRLIAGIAGCF
ncbi:hypothetical protein [Roseibium algae]|uniref:Uncharacterized protein n=1 Tax=Roseibium algae TaxID=3123038 RepID=A0ABU8TGX9_9HYPH